MSSFQKYMMKLKILKLDGYVLISEDVSGCVFKNLSYDYPYDRFSVPDFIYRLDDGCFSGVDLVVVKIGKSVTSIGSNCFSNCNKLELIIIDKNSELEIDLKSLSNANKARIKVITD